VKNLTVVPYTSADKAIWDTCVRSSKNGTFLFYRDYCEYHADRFTDHSLLFFDETTLIAIMPANIAGDTVVSHGGLTYGGVISGTGMKAGTMLQLFDVLIGFLKSQGIAHLIYKAVPHIYHRLPAEEDLYALYVNGASLIRRDASATLFLRELLPFGKGRKGEIKRGKAAGLAVSQDHDFECFLRIQEELLRVKYNRKPTHTSSELERLAGLFPDNIKLFTARHKGQMLAGIVIYETDVVAHAQYISATDEGKSIGAVDVILDYLINDYYREKKYLDFGISTEDSGRYLNAGLMQNKESYGARTIAYDFYGLDLTK
jgi:hypothetical protein